MSGWQDYVYQLLNSYNPNDDTWKNNVCEHAAIYGIDGELWAASPGFELSTYDFNLTLEDESQKSVNVNEFTTALEATKGNREGSEAGIRMGNQKYVMIRYNPDQNVAYLGREGGGACVARTNMAVLIGIWNKAGVMSNELLQNSGDCNIAV